MDKIDSLVQFQQTALRIQAQRQELLSSNIANADTPNYKAKDIDFKQALTNAMSGVNNGSLALATTSANHLEAKPLSLGLANAPVMYRVPTQPSIDGNTVEMDVERAQFADNALRYQAGIQFASSKLKGILTALQNQ